MKLCPRCKKMTIQADLYTGELVCYNGDCYEIGFVVKPKGDRTGQDSGDQVDSLYAAHLHMCLDK